MKRSQEEKLLESEDPSFWCILSIMVVLLLFIQVGIYLIGSFIMWDLIAISYMGIRLSIALNIGISLFMALIFNRKSG